MERRNSYLSFKLSLYFAKETLGSFLKGVFCNHLYKCFYIAKRKAKINPCSITRCFFS